MANTLTVNTVKRGEKQFQGLFNEMWTVKATVADQDAVSANDTAAFTMTVPGVALGDIVVAGGLNVDLSDGTDQAVVEFKVTAANTVTMYVHADVGEFAADDLNSAVAKLVVARPNW
jgi:hypothetical protein